MMIRRFSGYLLAILLLVVINAAPALTDTYFVYDQYGGTWHDANKTGDDSLMCWAATASNILAWGDWGTSLYDTETTIFQYFKEYWTNGTGQMSYAWHWWFDGSPPTYNIGSTPEGGGNFYPDLNLNDYFVYASGGNIMATIDNLFHQGKGVGLVISNGSNSHAVTAWGYEYSEPGVYTSIYLTDSDDAVMGLRNYGLILEDDVWKLGGALDGYSNNLSGYQINNVQSLGYFPAPIAPSWVLLGTGVFSLFLLKGLRRRRPGEEENPPL
jgi:hypothetical protein